MLRRTRLALAASLFAATVQAGSDLLPPLSVDALRQQAFDVEVERVRPLDDGANFSAYLVGYEHAGLRLFAMIAVPGEAPPPSGYPVVIANHGYVPDPRRYGITAEGRDSRPGDYYRSVPGLFAGRGFLTVIPDYRGHNSSEGFEYIDPQDEDSVGYYAEDVVALISALEQLEHADTDNVFMWSHSMGGSVSLRAMLATDLVRASSFWATMNLDDLAHRIGELDGPVMLHHAEGDTATPFSNSESFADALSSTDLLAGFHAYAGDEHFFGPDLREKAAETDAAFFRSLLR